MPGSLVCMMCDTEKSANPVFPAQSWRTSFFDFQIVEVYMQYLQVCV